MSLRSLEDASEAASRDKSNNAPVATTTTTTTTSAAGIEYEAPSTQTLITTGDARAQSVIETP